MKPNRWIAIATLAAGVSLSAAAAPGLLEKKSGEPEFLPVDQAFELQPLQRAGRGVTVSFRITKDYYLYRDRLKFVLVSPAGTAVPTLPAGEPYKDEHFGTVTVYRGDLAIPVTLPPAAAKAPLQLKVTYQGCADAGLCYPPQTQTLDLAE